MFTLSKILRGVIYPRYFMSEMALVSSNRLQKNKNVHTNPNLCVKTYIEIENRYAYNLMKDSGYAISLDLVNDDTKLTTDEFDQLMKENWSKLQPKQLFDLFSTIGAYASTNGLCISNKVFDDFIDSLTDNIKQASDEELKLLFHSLHKWPETENIRTRNFIEVWAALDDACLNRMKVWDYDQMLRFVALFYMLNVTKFSEFSQKVINKLATKAKQISPSQMVQTFFYVGILRRQPYDMHNLELHMIDCFEELSLNDIAIMSMGFFKSKTPIRSMELVKKIINKIVDNPKDIHEVSLASILKVIRYSVKINTDDKIYRLLDTLQHEIHRLSIMCIVHLALLGTSTLTFHNDCLSKIAEKVINQLSNARTKDLERLVLTYGTFNFVPSLKTKDCFFEKIADEFRKPEREPEINKHGRSFACCVNYLGMVGKYPVDLMDRVLSPSFLLNTYGKQCQGYGREILAIHNNSVIFYPDTEMNRLTDKAAIILAKRYTDFVPDENFIKQYNITERMVLDVLKALRDERGGNEFVKGDHLLPHHQRGDIIICNSQDGVPLPVTEKLNTQFGLLKRPPDENHWIVFVISGRNAIIHGINTPSGPFLAKIRELKALGYHGVLVPWSVYIKKKTKEELQNYLNQLIKSTET